MPNIIDPREVLWGRQGLGAAYFGVELIAEAIWEVFNAAELGRLRNLVPFPGAFLDHHFQRDWRPSETCHSYPYMDIELTSNISEHDLECVCGVGVFNTRYGLVKREDTASLAAHRWVSSEEWDLIKYASIIKRKTEPDHMPSEQVVCMNNHSIFLSRSRKLIVFTSEWEAWRLGLELYLPSVFTVKEIVLRDVFDLTEEGILNFCQIFGGSAGAQLLDGLGLQLQSTIHQVRKELEKNEKAHEMASLLRLRIGT